VEGDIADPIIETIAVGLKRNAISEIDDNPSEMGAGWTNHKDPYSPNFENSNFLVGSYIVFSLRIDKKTVPSKMVQKHFAAECSKRLKESGRDFLSSNEKKMIKDHVINLLNLKIPSTPNVYDILWRYESRDVWFFSNLKTANEQLESLFAKSFHLRLIRKIPYTMAYLDQNLSNNEKDVLTKLSKVGHQE
jgi:hypothetical protein